MAQRELSADPANSHSCEQERQGGLAGESTRRSPGRSPGDGLADDIVGLACLACVKNFHRLEPAKKLMLLEAASSLGGM